MNRLNSARFERANFLANLVGGQIELPDVIFGSRGRITASTWLSKAATRSCAAA